MIIPELSGMYPLTVTPASRSLCVSAVFSSVMAVYRIASVSLSLISRRSERTLTSSTLLSFTSCTNSL